MKKGQRRQKTQVERDRREIARLYLRGELQVDIGERLGLSQQTISNDLKVMQEQWKTDRVNDINERKNIELARIDELEREYWDAWSESKKDEQTKKAVSIAPKKKNGQPGGGEVAERVVRQEITSKGQVGNPAFLRGVEWCINKRCDILGLDAPKNLDLTSNGGDIKILVEYADNKG